MKVEIIRKDNQTVIKHLDLDLRVSPSRVSIRREFGDKCRIYVSGVLNVPIQVPMSDVYITPVDGTATQLTAANWDDLTDDINGEEGGMGGRGTWIGTRAEFDALEDPADSGLYPSLIGKDVIITDEFPDNAVIVDCYPDYTNKETVNRISTNNGTWTVDRDGFVVLDFNVPSNNGVAFYINDVFVGGHYVSSSSANEICETFKVKKGDIVRMVASAFSNCSCYFVPPKYSTVTPTPQIQVEIGTDYSTDEKPVLVKDADTGEIRQKLDIDGSPIWERTFTGTITAAINTDITTTLLTGIKSGWFTRFSWQIGGGDSGWYGTGPTYGASSYAIYSAALFRVTSTLALFSRSQAIRDGITNSGYLITAQYTKP